MPSVKKPVFYLKYYRACGGLLGTTVLSVTFGRLEGLVVERAPADRVDVGRRDVTPEVSARVLVVAVVTQPQQLAARHQDRRQPVGVAAVRLVLHLKLH